MKPRIMYVERKGGGSGEQGPARIMRVTFSKSGSSVYVEGRRLQTLAGAGWKANYADVETGEEYWVSGPKRDGKDRLHGGWVEIDEDVREEYWTEIRAKPEFKERTRYHC